MKKKIKGKSDAAYPVSLDPKNPNAQVINIKLTNAIIKYKTRKNKTTRYAVQKEIRILGPAGNKTLGKGAFGKVNEIVATLEVKMGRAVKTLKQKEKIVKKISSGNIKAIEAESQLLIDLPHIGAHEVMTNVNKDKENAVEKAYIVMKKLPGEGLDKILRNDKSKKNPLTVEERYQLSIALLTALQSQVHEYGIIHQDIKPDNILCNIYEDNGNRYFEINFIDFGSATKASDPKKAFGVAAYLAPESLKNELPTTKVDVYAIGKVLGQIWHGSVNSPASIAQDIPNLPVNPYRNQLIQLINNLTNENPKTRDINKAIETLVMDLHAYQTNDNKNRNKPEVIANELMMSERIYEKNEYKSALIVEIKKYFDANKNKSKLFSSTPDRANSDRRLSDMRNILDIIHNSKSNKYMEEALEDYFPKMTTGFSRSSVLRDNLKRVISEHRQQENVSHVMK